MSMIIELVFAPKDLAEFITSFFIVLKYPSKIRQFKEI